MLATTLDPDRRTVVLFARHWEHITVKHPDLGVGPDMLMDAVAAPDRHLPGREDGEEWFYRHGAGPSPWLKVVVHYEHGLGVVATAFARRAFP